MFTIKQFVDEIHSRHLTPELLEIAQREGLPAYESDRHGGSFRTIMTALFPEWTEFSESELNTAKQTWGKAVAVVLREWGLVPDVECPTPMSDSTDPKDIKNAHCYKPV